jgi:undecaprenyl diphosphate synthase
MHVGIIMDGNGRWAQLRGLPRIEGHRQGANSVRDVVRAARQLGIQALTLYAFSAQNWARPVDEVKALMELLRDYLLGERSEIMDNGIRLCAIGDLGRLPVMVREPLDALIADSAANPHMTLCLALSYGGQESLVDAARSIAAEVAAGRLDPARIDADALRAHLATGKVGLPALDLVIRTSGEQRLSNFLLWESAYAELYFTDHPWPDFRRADFEAALAAYAARQRRYGMTAEQLLAEQASGKAPA